MSRMIVIRHEPRGSERPKYERICDACRHPVSRFAQTGDHCPSCGATLEEDQ